MGWTYSIDYETKDEGGEIRYATTMVAAPSSADAVAFFMKNNPGAEIRELRRIRHD